MRGSIHGPAVLLLLLAVGCAAPGLPRAPATIVAPLPGGSPFDRLTRTEAPDDLRVGAAAIEITPASPRGMYLAGFGPDRQARGVLDPLYARALVVADAEVAVAIVSLDLVGTTSGTAERIGSLASPEHPERILVTVTHNHHAPDPLGYWGPSLAKLVPVHSGVDPRYLAYVERRAALAIHRAAASARPARIRAAQLPAPEGICRCLYPSAQTPPLVSLSFDEPDGQPIATWLHYACHPETLWDRNQLISADWAGEVYRALERIRGGTALVTVGALAGRAPEPVFDGSLRDRYWQKRQSGRALAETAFRAVAEERRAVPARGVRLWWSEIELPVESWEFLFAARSGIYGEDLTEDTLLTRVALLELGSLRIGFVPGELSAEAGAAIRERMAGEPSLLVNLTHSEPGYVLTEAQFADTESEYMQYLKAVSLGSGTFPIIYEAMGTLVAQAAAAENLPSAPGEPRPVPAPAPPKLSPPQGFTPEPAPEPTSAEATDEEEDGEEDGEESPTGEPPPTPAPSEGEELQPPAEASPADAPPADAAPNEDAAGEAAPAEETSDEAARPSGDEASPSAPAPLR